MFVVHAHFDKLDCKVDEDFFWWRKIVELELGGLMLSCTELNCISINWGSPAWGLSLKRSFSCFAVHTQNTDKVSGC